MSLSGNDYFTYFFDGNTSGCHRSGTQVRTIACRGTEYTIYLAGEYTNSNGEKKYNGFAKKHLITFRNGSFAAGKNGSQGPRSKAEDILVNRVAKHGLKAYNEERKSKRDDLDDENKGDYPLKPLGGANTSVNTVVICDYIDPDELWMAFARGLNERGKKTPWKAGDERVIKVEFQIRRSTKEYCIISNEYNGGRISENGNVLYVLAYCSDAQKNALTAHIVHYEGVD